MTLEDQLRQNAERWPAKAALICGGRACSYNRLYDEACRKAEALGDAQGRAVVLTAAPTEEFVASYLAAHMAGAAAVPVDRSLPDEQRRRLAAALGSQPVPEGVADILYTTGTTGQPKAVMVGHRAIAANAANLVEAQGYHEGLTFVVNGPLSHIGSLSKVYTTLWAGGTVHLVDGLRDLDAFFRAVEQTQGCAATFLVPAAIRMMLTLAADRLAACAPKLELVETGAAPMPLADMQQLCRLLPRTRLYNTYASTETGIIATYDYNGGECLEGCLGAAMRHSAMHITPDGRVACSGATLMHGYWNDAEATARVVHDGTLVTADCGRIDSHGRLRLTGRDDDTINVGGYKIAPAEVERCVLAFPGVTDCVCVAAAHPLLGTVPKLLVVAGGKDIRLPLMRFLRTRLEPHQMPVLYEEVDAVRRTFNGKIDRKSYRQT